MALLATVAFSQSSSIAAKKDLDRDLRLCVSTTTRVKPSVFVAFLFETLQSFSIVILEGIVLFI